MATARNDKNGDQLHLEMDNTKPEKQKSYECQREALKSRNSQSQN